VQERTSARFRATVHYDGSAFHGWQSQPDRRTVQDALEEVLARLLSGAVSVLASGRTDAGVHAAGQEIAFPAGAGWSASDLHRAMNAVLPADIWVEELRETSREFHPRFDARARRYEYYVATGREAASPLRAGRVWSPGTEPDPRLLVSAAAELPGERSFAAFAKSGQEERGDRCAVGTSAWSTTALGDLRFTIVADRFLHHMVRYLVRTQVEIASGRREPDELARLLAGEPGVRPPAPAPPQGLYLTGVRYDDGWNRGAGVPGLTAPAVGDADPRRDPQPSQARGPVR